MIWLTKETVPISKFKKSTLKQVNISPAEGTDLHYISVALRYGQKNTLIYRSGVGHESNPVKFLFEF